MPETFATAAAKGFQALAVQYDLCRRDQSFNGNFWHAANALRTCLDYLLYSKQPDARGLLLAGEVQYNRLLGASNWWRDDYAWWGNVFLLACSHRAALGYASPAYDQLFDNLLGYSVHCANLLDATWSDDPYGLKDDKGHGDHAAPGAGTVPGGVYNLPPAEQTDETLTGRNLVTNSGFWLLCQALQKANAKTAPTPDRIAKWFTDWLEVEAGGLFDQRAMLLDRPGGWYARPWCWIGDHGLLFRALTNAGDRETAHVIALSPFAHAANDALVLVEPPDTPFDFRVDYATGKGVFLRNLVQPGETPDDLVATAIKANASAVWLNRLDRYGHQFGFNWTGLFVNHALPGDTLHRQSLANLVMQAAGQDALNAALLIAPGEAIAGS